MNAKELLWSAIRKWGVEHQTKKAIEEMAELICEPTRAQDNRTTEDKIREIADAWITLQQQIFIHGESDVMGYVKQKLERLEERINGEI